MRRIGITFRDDQVLSQTWYGSGLSQNLKFLYDLYAGLGHDVCFVVNDPQAFSVSFGARLYQVVGRADVLSGQHALDVVLEAGSTLNQEECAMLRGERQTRIVALRYGSVMLMDMEGVMTKRDLSPGLHTVEPDVVWASPHFERSFSYLGLLYDAPVRTCPYLWEPDFMGAGDYPLAPAETPDIYVMEPNISLIKNALLPMAIIESLYREDPDAFGKAYILNAAEFYQLPGFLHNFVTRFGSLRAAAEKVYFAPRAAFSDTFRRADVMLGFQHLNELNYLYNEALYAGVPLVHNSPDYRDVGYYYEAFDVDGGRDALRAAIATGCPPDVHAGNRAFLQAFSIHNAANADAYQALLDAVLDS